MTKILPRYKRIDAAYREFVAERCKNPEDDLTAQVILAAQHHQVAESDVWREYHKSNTLSKVNKEQGND